MPKPVVAIVGRPNVGKSALFNRLAGQRLAVVDDVPGTTRDRLYAESEWVGTQFLIVDTGGIDPTTVTRGREPLSIGSAEFIQQIREQAQQAVSDADLVMFVVDVESGVTPADREVASILRRSQRKQGDALLPPVLLVVNKVDSVQRRENLAEFYELGMGEPHPVSAVHGSGTGDMLDAMVAALPPQVEDPEEADADLSVAIVGKPNAGKSTLLNALVGEERAIVSDIPGTTRDTVDSFIDFEGQRIKLIDTAGLRRRGKIEPGVEKYSAIRSVRAIERADVVLLVIDATTGITAQDAHIAGYVQDAWKSAVILVNKWDAVDKDTYSMEQYTRNIRYVLKFIDYAPMVFISAQSGQRVQDVLPTAAKVGAERMVKLSTSQVNRVLEDAQEHQPAPNRAGRNLRIYYGTQVRSDPPTFLLYCNEPKLLHFTYERYLENRIREAYGFLGTPIRIVAKQRE